MKKLVLILMIVLPLCLNAQIVEQPGIVREQTYALNAKQIPISEVKIKVKDNIGIQSEADGSFLLLISDNDKDVFKFDYINKIGYMLIAPPQDKMATQSFPLNPNVPVTIVMTRRDSYQNEKQRIENNIRSKKEKELDVMRGKIDSLTSLSKDETQQKKLQRQIDSLEKSFNELQNKYLKSDDFITQEAARLAKIDYATLDSLEVIITNLLKAGDGYGVVDLVKSQISPQLLTQLRDNPALLTQDIAQAKQILDNKKRQREQISKLFFDMASGYAVEFQYDSAYYFVDLCANTDTTNLENLRKCASFLQEQNQMYEAVYFYEIALRSIRKLVKQIPDSYNSILADILNNLGALHQTLGQYLKAEQEYSECMTLRRALAAESPDDYNPDLARILNNLGRLHFDLGQYLQAEQEYLECLTLSRALVAMNPDAFIPSLATILNSLGILHNKLGNYPKAEEEYSECLTLRRALAAKNPDAINPDLAIVLNNFGCLHFVLGHYTNAEQKYSECLVLYRTLAANNPDANNPDLAVILNNIGSFHSELEQYTKAEQEYSESLTISRTLAVNNPDFYNSRISDILNCLSYNFACQNKFENAIDNINEAIALFPEDPNYYYSKAKILMMKGDKDAAMKEYDKILKLNPNYFTDFEKDNDSPTELYKLLFEKIIDKR